MIDYALVLL